MNDVLVAYLRAMRSQMHPSMLMLLIGPLVLAIVFWVLMAWFLWEPLTREMADWLFDSDGWLAGIAGALDSIGLSSAKAWVPGLITLMLTFPLLMGVTLVFVSMVATPIVMRHLIKTDYPEMTSRGSFNVSSSAWNVFKAGVIFVVGYIASIPLWFVPPLSLIVPLLWWAWLTSRIMRFDSLSEHATSGETKSLIMQHRAKYFGLGVLVAVLNYIPPLFIVAPVFSALAFGHYSLKALRDFRHRGVSSPPR